MKHILSSLILILFVLNVNAQKINIVNPTVEQLSNPQALHTAQPRFSWQYQVAAGKGKAGSGISDVVQTSYRIIVASTYKNAKNGIGDLWDTKEVLSSKMLYIPYDGKALKSRDKAYWTVQTVVACGKEKTPVTITSDVQNFTVSLLDSADWQAQWIGHEFYDDVLQGHTRVAARYLRKEMRLADNVSSARLYISGLGQYSAYINGIEVAPDEILKPALSDYRKRVYFNAYDVTDMLRKGDNAIGVVLAGGRFTGLRINAGKGQRDGTLNMVHYGTPRLLLQLEVTYSDGSKELIVSDRTWKITNKGTIRTSNEYDGETFDANLGLGRWTEPGYDDNSWYTADLVRAPFGKVVPQPNPNIKVQDQLTPVGISRHGDIWMVDMGQNMVGYASIRLKGLKKGDTVTLRFAEMINPDGSLNKASIRAAEATDRFVSNGHDTTWHPMFTYHGFRYIEISGLRQKPTEKDIKGLVFYDEMPVTGTFVTDNEIINAVYRNAYWTIRGNYRSMPTDCPQRDERMGWNGDRTTGCYGESYIFGNSHLYSKWLTDADDSQLETGSLPEVMPAYWRFYSNSMTWPGAIVTVADMLYTRFGDIQPIVQHYRAMKKWLVFMKVTYMKNGIMTKDTYGDWCLPPESPELVRSMDSNRITKAPVLSTPFYCYLCGKMEKFAELLGNEEDVRYFHKEVAATKKAFTYNYFSTSMGWYDNNTVTANLQPLAFGMVPKGYENAVFENIVNKTEKDHGGHVSTGVVGIQQFMRTLTDYGRGDLAFKIATNEDYPSWGYMVRSGATTIWEMWNGNTIDPARNSNNHVMLLGDLIIWEYEYLAGIRPAEPGYSKIVLKPCPVEGLKNVKCSYQSVSGLIESSWTLSNGVFQWEVVLPPNTTADIYLPTADGYKLYENVGSGRMHFASEIK